MDNLLFVDAGEKEYDRGILRFYKNLIETHYEAPIKKSDLYYQYVSCRIYGGIGFERERGQAPSAPSGQAGSRRRCRDHRLQ